MVATSLDKRKIKVVLLQGNTGNSMKLALGTARYISSVMEASEHTPSKSIGFQRDSRI